MEERDKVLGIIAVLGAAGLFMQPLLIICGAAILAVPFGVLYLVRR